MITFLRNFNYSYHYPCDSKTIAIRESSYFSILNGLLMFQYGGSRRIYSQISKFKRYLQ